jgi:hypothetical protein
MKLSKGKIYAIKFLMEGISSDIDSHLYILSAILGRKINDYEDLEYEDWKVIRNMAWENHYLDDYRLSKDFIKRCESLNSEFLERKSGQMMLFGG